MPGILSAGKANFKSFQIFCTNFFFYMQCLTVYIFLYFSPCSLNFLTLYFIHFTLHFFIVLPDDLVFFFNF